MSFPVFLMLYLHYSIIRPTFVVVVAVVVVVGGGGVYGGTGFICKDRNGRNNLNVGS